MMPLSEQMLAAAQLALKEHVMPLVEDQWAASALRSVDVILQHLQARVPGEGPMLHADTRDLADMLGTVADALDVVAVIDPFRQEAQELLAGYASVGELAALNCKGRQIVDDLLHECRKRKADGSHALLRAYLMRHL
ncbi:MAG: hypothetical protein RL367_336, partial [Pseudomonadota bacterium]